MPRIAVTAASGQLGSAVVHALKSRVGAENILALARKPEKAAHLGVPIAKGDYNHEADFVKALSGVDAVLIVSSNAQPDARIQQHLNIINGAKAAGVGRLVYTSVGGPDPQSAFSPIIKSNRQSEVDVQASGLEWVIGRNSLYIEPDLEYIDTYITEGGISNCAGEGRCAYTSRAELATAYVHMLLEDGHAGQVYSLAGRPITQGALAQNINKVFGTQLSYQFVTPEAYIEERKAALGEVLGTIISGIYVGIHRGAFDLPSDFEKVVGRPHLSPIEMMEAFKAAQV